MKKIMCPIKFNVNITVRFKPTSLGAEYLERYAETARFDSMFTPNTEGYYEMRLWQCMNIFGDVRRSGGGAGLFEKGDLIIVPEENTTPELISFDSLKE